MKKPFLIAVLAVAVAVLLGLGAFYFKNLRGLWPILKPATGEISKLKLPEGFGMEIFAKNLSGARVIVMDGMGNMWVSRASEGIVTLLERRDGKVTNQIDIFRGLNRPHGLTFDPHDPLTLY